MAVTFLRIETGKDQFIEFAPNDSAALTLIAIPLSDTLIAAVGDASGLAKVREFLARLVFIWQAPHTHWVLADWLASLHLSLSAETSRLGYWRSCLLKTPLTIASFKVLND